MFLRIIDGLFAALGWCSSIIFSIIVGIAAQLMVLTVVKPALVARHGHHTFLLPTLWIAVLCGGLFFWLVRRVWKNEFDDKDRYVLVSCGSAICGALVGFGLGLTANSSVPIYLGLLVGSIVGLLMSRAHAQQHNRTVVAWN